MHLRMGGLTRGTRVSVCASDAPLAATPTCSGSNAWNGGWIVFTDDATSETSVSVGHIRFTGTGEMFAHMLFVGASA